MRKRKLSVLLVTILFSVLGIIGMSQQEVPMIKTVAENQNIQVPKDISAAQLVPAMHQIRVALGVNCDYCHIAEDNKYYIDDKPQKLIIRKMLLMVKQTNDQNSGGNIEVTFNTCHRIKPIFKSK